MDTSCFKNDVSIRQAQATAAEIALKPTRKKAPPKLAVINQNGCTGCEVCIVFCPVDCIEVVPGENHAEVQKVVEVDLDRCIGCSLCAKNCPWETIAMMNHDEALREAPNLTLRSVCDQPVSGVVVSAP